MDAADEAAGGWLRDKGSERLTILSSSCSSGCCSDSLWSRCQLHGAARGALDGTGGRVQVHRLLLWSRGQVSLSGCCILGPFLLLVGCAASASTRGRGPSHQMRSDIKDRWEGGRQGGRQRGGVEGGGGLEGAELTGRAGVQERRRGALQVGEAAERV